MTKTSKPKFKIGDKVKIKRAPVSTRHWVGEIIDHHPASDEPWMVKFEGELFPSARCYEFVEMNLVTDQLKRLPIRKPPMTPKQAKKKSALTEWMKNDPADDIKI